VAPAGHAATVRAMTTTPHALLVPRDNAPTPTGGRRVSTPVMLGAIAAVAAVDRTISLFTRRSAENTATVITMPRRHEDVEQEERAA
jgi:hypothetical protein